MFNKIKAKFNRICALISPKKQLNKVEINTNQTSSNNNIELQIEYNEFGYPQNIKKIESNKHK